jgi:Calcineurin-like phosphoesterase
MKKRKPHHRPTPAPVPAPVSAAGRQFADPRPAADESTFQVDNTSSAYYHSAYYLAHQSQLQAVPKPGLADPVLTLASVIGTAAIAPIVAAKRISFHATGDTGAAKMSAAQGAAVSLRNQGTVADAMAAEVQSGGADSPAFLFHLGDIIYNFGEGQYYYDQFYEPYRTYDRPIFAIPGNHDGVVFGANPDVPQTPSLQAFLRNFCATTPGPSPDAGGLVRSVMTQPGPYFTLDAPFLSVIGLYSNVLEGPGVISSQGGHYPIDDSQLDFLKAELARLKPEHDAGTRAVIIAVHHPPASVDSKHGGSTGLAGDIDAACSVSGLWPDAVLSGHAHLYQRFSRTVPGLAHPIPYVVCGSGGFAVTPPMGGSPPAGTTVGDYTLVVPPVMDFGYLTLTVDLSAARGILTISFRSPTQVNEHDSVTVPLPTPHATRPVKAASGSASVARPHRHGAAVTATRRPPPGRR